MYKLEHTSDNRLKSMVGKRVEVTGRVDAEANDASGQPPASAETNKTDRIVGHDRIDLPEFEVSSIRVVLGQLPGQADDQPISSGTLLHAGALEPRRVACALTIRIGAP